LKKSRLLASLDAALLAPVPTSSMAGHTSHSNSVADQESLDMDAEFAAFQVLLTFMSVTYTRAPFFNDLPEPNRACLVGVW